MFNHRVVEYKGEQYPIPDEGLECYVRDSFWSEVTFRVIARTRDGDYITSSGGQWKQANPVHLKRKKLSLETCPDDTRIYHKVWMEGTRCHTDVTNRGLEGSNFIIPWKELNDPETPWRWWSTKKPTCEVE